MERSKEFLSVEPGAWMRRVVREFDRLFDDRGLPFFRPRRRELDDFPWMPELEMFERDHYFIVRVDLPGLKKEDISLEVTGDGLTISGERKYETEEKRHGWFTSERTYGRFYRAIPLPDGIDVGKVKATFINGVLEVSVPLQAMTAAVPPRNVPIEEVTEKKTTKTAA